MDFSNFAAQAGTVLSRIVIGILIALAAWLIASLVRRGANKAFDATNFDKRLQNWGVANDQEQADNTVSAISNALYYLVWVFFLPPIFNAFGLSSIATPISNMFQTAFSYIPNIIGAIIIVVLGFFVAKFVKNLVYNLAVSVNVDGVVNRVSHNESSDDDKNTIANVLGNIVYVLVLIPILIVALETLGIRSITEPIIGVLNTILSAIPNILVAAILIGVGIAIARVAGNLLSELLEGAGINRVNELFESDRKVDIANVIGQFVAVIIALFFFVEALNALNLEVLNTVGAAIIGYLPNIIGAAVILGLGIFGGELLAGFVTNSSGSKWFGQIVKYGIIIFTVFMAVNQLGLATDIINTGFLLVTGGLAVAFALAFGLGGRDFAQKQLSRLDNKLEVESEKEDSVETLDQKIQKRYQELEKKEAQGSKAEDQSSQRADDQAQENESSSSEASGQGSRSIGDSIDE